MDDDLNYIGSKSKEFQSRELDAFHEALGNTEPRFTQTYSPMFSCKWANDELIPFLRRAYAGRPGITDDRDWWADLQKAEWIEPQHMVGLQAPAKGCN